MLGLIFSALRARRVPALVMLVLAGLTTGAAVGAGAVADRTERAATTARLAAATPAERTLSMRGSVALGTEPTATMARFRDLITGVDAERSVVGVRFTGQLRVLGAPRADGTRRTDDLRLPVELRAVDDFCANATFAAGRCVTADGEIVLGADVARQLGLAVGDSLRQDGGVGSAEVPLTLVGLYAPADPLGWYWSSLDGAAGAVGYTTVVTVAKAGGTASATYDALLPASAFDDPAAVDATVQRLRAGSLEVYSGAPGLAAAVAADRREVRRGLLVAQLQVLLFGALAVAVAAAYAAQERRPDAARMAIRGLPRRRILTATAGQSLLPLLAGAGWALAVRPSLWPALAVGVVLVVAADWPATRASVPQLLRVAQPARPLVAATVEVCVLAVGAAAVFQVLSEPPGDVRRDTGLGLSQIAPLVIALAFGVLATRALLSAAGATGRTALAGGRVGPALAGLSLGRRRTAFRIVPVLAAAACVLALAAQDWSGASTAREERAVVEVGADRVVKVAPVSRERLLAAVRAADPAGRHAMAVVVTGAAGADPVIAVDSARLRAVTGLDLPGLRGAASGPVHFTGTRLALERTGEAVVTLRLAVQTTGEAVTAVFQPAETETTVAACADGCRLVALSASRYPAEFTALRADGRVVVDGATFADPARWRTTLGEAVATVQAGHRDGRLRLQGAEPPSDRPRDDRLYVVDTPVPLPAVAAGALKPSGDDVTRVRIFGVAMPVVARQIPAVPRAGAAGVMLDLEHAARIAAGARGGLPDIDAGRAEVWLGEDAPGDMPDRLRAAGLTVVGEDSVAAAEDRAALLAPARTLVTGLIGALFTVLLAAVAAAVVAGVDRRQRTAELLALRRQGLSARTARAVGRWTAVAPVLVAVPVGLLTAVLLRVLTPAPVRPFTDDWPVAVTAVQWPAIVVTAVVLLAVLLPVVLLPVSAPRTSPVGGRGRP